MNEVYECGTCGVVGKSSQELCQPLAVQAKDDYCGSAGETAEMCMTMIKTLPYECDSCGRPAEEAELLCKPIATK
ncbi:MAG: hypothetical protein IH614_12030 [Desulfuromonadales bacterium]|nr:hypothetical protein [Desulfuromonadales bacterium]